MVCEVMSVWGVYLEVHDLSEGALGIGRVAEGVEALLEGHHLRHTGGCC